MKLVMDERLKHRLVGFAVIVSLVAIFLPAIWRQSSQRLDENLSVQVKLPSKPLAPDVVVKDEAEVFKTIKVAQIALPKVPTAPQVAAHVQAKPLKADPLPEKAVAVQQAPVKHPVLAEQIQPKLPVKQKLAHKLEPLAVKKDEAASPLAKKSQSLAQQHSASIYAVQVASFSLKSNALSLVERLQARGYKAKFVQVSAQKGPVYKVYAGLSKDRATVMKLRMQLAASMQLQGFVVNTGLS